MFNGMTKDTMLRNWPLLAPKPLCLWTPEEYQSYIQSLYVAPAPRKLPKVRLKKPKPVPKLISRLTSRGALSLTTKRKPKWITVAERDSVCAEFNLKQREIWRILSKKDFVTVANEADGIQLSKDIEELPW